ncbi:TonB-dependent receptor domain-containing protein [Frateuria aurantia]
MALYSGGVLAQSTNDNSDSSTTGSKAKNLDQIVVTGSLVKRVDAETANPVTILDRTQIVNSGAQTLGDLIQSMPGISGAATNPAVNNGGGDGASGISLRGLGAQRTLVLVDGHRINNKDANSIPANMVERIEMLKVGAGTLYGSDAVGGVVNFILRKDFTGLELNTDYGISSKHDGGRNGDQITFGKAWKRGHLVFGLDYNNQREISSANRAFSKNAMYLSSGSVYAGGSSRNPNGRVYLDAANTSKYGCASVTKSGSGYKCYTSADAYNYQAENLIMTPQRRMNAFLLGTFDITDNIQAYAELYHDRTMSSSAIAAVPFDAQANGVTIPADNQYNTFGQEFGPNGYEFLSRWTGLGQRVTNVDTNTDQDILGVKGAFGDSSWSWDVNFDYGHQVEKTFVYGLIDDNALQEALDANTTGVDVFDQASASTVAWMKAHQSVPHTTTDYSSSQWQGSVNGELWDMAGGPVELAAGLLYRSEHENYSVSANAVTQPSDGYTCGVGSSYCGTPLGGGFDVKEAYTQIFFPLLGPDSPIGAFNMTLGDRESSYSSAGPNNSAEVQFEWRPIKDLLLRGTVAQVFRAPTIDDLYEGATASAPVFTDPCIGYSGSGHSNACQGVPTGWAGSGLGQTNAIITGAQAAGVNLKPEKGESFDYGLVYSPSWAPGFSTSLDWWKYSLNNTITTISAQTVVNTCYQDNSSPYCNFIHRYTSGPSAGNINYIETPTVNLGHLLTEGVDWNIGYIFPHSRFGDFRLNIDTTYTSKYNVDPNPGGTGDVVLKLAGSYTSSYGNFSHVRSRGTLNWNRGNWSAQWATRLIGPIHVGFADTAYGYSADYEYAGVVEKYGSRVYHDLSISYAVPVIKTTFSIGVDNLMDKTPPILYQNNVINANTDVSTYDTVGRYYWARASIKFW